MMKFLLFGTGDYYQRYKKWFAKEDVVALLDNSLAKQNTIIDGIRVLAPTEGIKLSFDVVVVLSFYVKEIRKQLKELGVPEEKVYHFYDLHRLFKKRERKTPICCYGGAERVLEKVHSSDKRILLLSQDLTFGGPAIALFHAAEILVKHGYEVVYGSMLDGPLREKLLEKKIPVIVDVNLQVDTMEMVEWVNNFSLIVCNTINFYVFLSERKSDIPILWWLHDSAFFYDGVDKAVLRGIDRDKLEMVSVGPVPKGVFQSYMTDMSVEYLFYGVTDTVGSTAKRKQNKDKFCFVTIGYIEERKGQDILLKALEGIPENIRKNAVFYFVGQDTSAMAQELKEEAGKRLPEVKFTGAVNREEIERILQQADVLVCPSREDPMPTVAAEAMMNSVPCMLSDATGTAALIQDHVSGMVVPCENVSALTDKIIWCMEHAKEVEEMGKASRKVFENHFSMEVFETELLKKVDGILANVEQI